MKTAIADQRDDEEHLQRCEDPTATVTAGQRERLRQDLRMIPTMYLVAPGYPGTRRIVPGRLGPAESVRATQA